MFFVSLASAAPGRLLYWAGFPGNSDKWNTSTNWCVRNINMGGSCMVGTNCIRLAVNDPLPGPNDDVVVTVDGVDDCDSRPSNSKQVIVDVQVAINSLNITGRSAHPGAFDPTMPAFDFQLKQGPGSPDWFTVATNINVLGQYKFFIDIGSQSVSARNIYVSPSSVLYWASGTVSSLVSVDGQLIIYSPAPHTIQTGISVNAGATLLVQNYLPGQMDVNFNGPVAAASGSTLRVANYRAGDSNGLIHFVSSTPNILSVVQGANFVVDIPGTQLQMDLPSPTIDTIQLLNGAKVTTSADITTNVVLADGNTELHTTRGSVRFKSLSGNGALFLEPGSGSKVILDSVSISTINVRGNPTDMLLFSSQSQINQLNIIAAQIINANAGLSVFNLVTQDGATLQGVFTIQNWQVKSTASLQLADSASVSINGNFDNTASSLSLKLANNAQFNVPVGVNFVASSSITVTGTDRDSSFFNLDGQLTLQFSDPSNSVLFQQIYFGPANQTGNATALVGTASIASGTLDFVNSKVYLDQVTIAGLNSTFRGTLVRVDINDVTAADDQIRLVMNISDVFITCPESCGAMIGNVDSYFTFRRQQRVDVPVSVVPIVQPQAPQAPPPPPPPNKVLSMWYLFMLLGIAIGAASVWGYFFLAKRRNSFDDIRLPLNQSVVGGKNGL